MSDKKKTIFSSILKSLKKVAKPFLSDKNTLDQMAAGLATTAILAQEVQASQKVAPTANDAAVDADQTTALDNSNSAPVDANSVVADANAAAQDTNAVADNAPPLPSVQGVQQAAADARADLHNVLEQAKENGDAAHAKHAAAAPHATSADASGGDSLGDVSSTTTVSSSSQLDSATGASSAALTGSAETVQTNAEITISQVDPVVTVSLNPINNLNLLPLNQAAPQAVAISGQAAGPVQVGDVVTVIINGEAYATTVVNAQGAFSVDVPAADLLSSGQGALETSYTGANGVATIFGHSYTVTDGGLHLSGKAIDGYISGAHVFYDADGDGKMDNGEQAWQATTDANGNFDLSVDASHITANGHIVVQGGVDSFTGQQLSGDLVSLAGSTLVTPLTTLLAFATDGTGVTLEQAQAQFKLALGIDPSIDLASYDPVAHMTSGNAADQLMAEHLFKAQQTIFTVMQATSALAEGDASAKIAMAS